MITPTTGKGASVKRQGPWIRGRRRALMGPQIHGHPGVNSLNILPRAVNRGEQGERRGVQLCSHFRELYRGVCEIDYLVRRARVPASHPAGAGKFYVITSDSDHIF